MSTFENSAVGDVVTLVQEVEGEAKKLPAIITRLYKNAHDDVIADLHVLEANVLGVPAKENATDTVSGTTGLHVVSKTTPSDEPATPPAAVAAVPAVTAPVMPADIAPVTDSAVSGAESAYSSLSPEDQAAFAAFLASKDAPAASAPLTAVPPNPLAGTSSTDATTG